MTDGIFEKLKKEDTYSMMLLLLYASSDNPRYSTLSELPFILDHENFIRFLKYYEGQTIQIPTLNETKEALRILSLFQYYLVDKMEWEDAIKKAGYTEEDTSPSIRIKLINFKKDLESHNYKLGGLLND